MKSDKYRNLLEKKPESGLYRFSLGQALLEEGQEEEAAVWFEHCIREKPDWMMASILKSKCLIRLGKRDQALSELDRALRLSIDQEHEAPEAEIRQMIQSLSSKAKVPDSPRLEGD